MQEERIDLKSLIIQYDRYIIVKNFFRKEILEILIFQYKTKDFTSETSFFDIKHKNATIFKKKVVRNPHTSFF